MSTFQDFQASQRAQIGEKLTRGKGAGSMPAIGQSTAEESRTKLQLSLKIPIWCSLPQVWWRNKPGAAPVVAKSQRIWEPTVGVVTKPFALRAKKNDSG